ncbi:hypothetical protein llap_1532 [Limosa lapponica baueri]|uniref:Uncharacterized protein n=1 Tax=Limosa lapponica baueri TaxID=1758121 RepID=A0A2I0UQ38_LIMLA|nr:hypothetical protein llap_1532 [Limosa lapponica baueri]
MVSNWESMEKEMGVRYWKTLSNDKNGEVIELMAWEGCGASIAQDYSNLYQDLHRCTFYERKRNLDLNQGGGSQRSGFKLMGSEAYFNPLQEQTLLKSYIQTKELNTEEEEILYQVGEMLVLPELVTLYLCKKVGNHVVTEANFASGFGETFENPP